MKKTDKAIWIIALIVIAVVVGVMLHNKNKVTDVTDLVNASESTVATKLGITLTDCPQMAAKVFHFSKSKNITVKGDPQKGIGIVYINGVQKGLYIENKEYKMFDVEIGKIRAGLDSRVTYAYDDCFEIDEEIDEALKDKRTDFPMFYYNRANNDSLVVSCVKSTGEVVAVTYFNDLKRITERLDF